MNVSQRNLRPRKASVNDGISPRFRANTSGKRILVIYKSLTTPLHDHELKSDSMPSHPIFGDRSTDEWIARYEESHKDPVNRVFHTFGIPMIALSIPLLLIAPFMRGFWKIAVGLFLTGWVFQFVGHAFEGRPPEFFKDWRFLFVGLPWWLKNALSRVQQRG